MGTPKVFIGHFSEDKFTFKPVVISKAVDWLRLGAFISWGRQDTTAQIW